MNTKVLLLIKQIQFFLVSNDGVQAKETFEFLMKFEI